MSASPVARLTLDDYLAIDHASDRPLEFHDGEIYPMVATTVDHSIIATNTTHHLANRLDGSNCRVAAAIRIRATAKNVVYPDIAVFCGSILRAQDAPDSAINPKLIVEVLSPSTEGYDHSEKFDIYCQLPTFEEYVLIAQDQPRVHVFHKKSDIQWTLTKYDGLQSNIKLESLGIELAASDIFSGVEFLPPS